MFVVALHPLDEFVAVSEMDSFESRKNDFRAPTLFSLFSPTLPGTLLEETSAYYLAYTRLKLNRVSARFQC